jgi:glycosyltransferase involved in cell wall biosynthesis
MTSRLLPHRIIHYAQHDPRTHVGGVETFARSLRLIFEEVEFMTPGTLDVTRVRQERIPVVCDNHWVLDFPPDIPVLGFQHGVARVKWGETRNWGDLKLLRLQARAARRPNTLWVACAQWISAKFQELHGNGAAHVIYHPVDLERFDGRLTGGRPHLILHDARTEHKGKSLVGRLARAFKEYQFEPLACSPQEVPDRMREARAFVHLSRYEGNSIVCNKAMAMNLPCFFTRVGLMQDENGPSDVHLIDPSRARHRPAELIASFSSFLSSLETRTYQPRTWSERYASPSASRRGWAAVMDTFTQRHRG